MTLLGSTARQLRSALSHAPDSTLEKVLAAVDSMPDRGAADALIAALRPRLRNLRPARPLRFGRLLTLPLEGALVEPTEWARDPAQLPRHALAPIIRTTADELGKLAEEIDAAGGDSTMADHRLVGTLGRRLWPMAGALRFNGLPTGWVEAGLAPRDAQPILDLCGALWRQAPGLWQARLAAHDGPPEPLIRAALAPLAAEGAAPLSAGMAFLLRIAGTPALVAAVAASLTPMLAPAAERALGAVIDGRAEALQKAESPGEMAERAAMLGRTLDDAETTGSAIQRDARRRKAQALRKEGAEACHARFVEALDASLLDPARAAVEGPRAEDAEVAALEEAARDLRKLEAAGRRLGQEAKFDRTLREAVMKLSALAAVQGGLGKVELARLVEILGGTEAAVALVPAPGAAA